MPKPAITYCNYRNDYFAVGATAFDKHGPTLDESTTSNRRVYYTVTCRCGHVANRVSKVDLARGTVCPSCTTTPWRVNLPKNLSIPKAVLVHSSGMYFGALDTLASKLETAALQTCITGPFDLYILRGPVRVVLTTEEDERFRTLCSLELANRTPASAPEGARVAIPIPMPGAVAATAATPTLPTFQPQTTPAVPTPNPAPPTSSAFDEVTNSPWEK